MQFWWCNQSNCFDIEYSAGVVQASDQMTNLRYRETVSQVAKGDGVIHYHKRRGVIALGKALSDATGPGRLDNLQGEYYESGWVFRCEYYLLQHPTSKAEWIDEVRPEENRPDWPINSNGNIKQAYFIPFDLWGFLAIVEHCSEPLPEWAGRLFETRHMR